MTLQALYDNAAESYDLANCFGAISTSHDIALEQILKARIGKPSLRCSHPPKILDLGVGDGRFLARLKNHIPNAQCTGFDISPEMLKLAQKRLEMTGICAGAQQAEHYLPLHSQDLVLAHFINAYIPIDTLFHQAHLMAKASGYFSYISTTYDSFPHCQEFLANFINENSFIGSMIGHYYKSVVKHTTVAPNLVSLKQKLSTHKFLLAEHRRIEIDIVFESAKDVARFGVDGSWFLNALDYPLVPQKLLVNKLTKLINKIVTFPFHDKHIIDIILAKK